MGISTKFSVRISPFVIFCLSFTFGNELTFSTGLHIESNGIGKRSGLVAAVAASGPMAADGQSGSTISRPRLRSEPKILPPIFEETLGLDHLLSGGEEFSVEVTNSGPAILGSTAQFTAKVRNGASGTYWFKWMGDVTPLPQNFLSSDVCNFNLSLTEEAGAKPGELSITVSVCKSEYLLFCKNPGKKVDGYSTIAVTETINGQILMSSNAIPQCNTTNPECTVPSKANVTVTASIYDPSNFFKEAFLLYRWDMGDGTQLTTASPELVYSYQGRGLYTVKTNLTAVFKSGAKKYGYWQKNITVLDALTNLQIKSSSKSVEVGNNEMVNVTCDGSPPILICLTIVEPAQPRNITNTTCETVLEQRCETMFTHYFQTTGEYTFEVAAHNNVSYLLNTSSIHAHQHTLEPKSVTTITLAVLAGIFMTCVAMAVFLQQVQKVREQHVEVANFDFQLSERSPSPRPGLLKWWRWRSAEKKPLLGNKSSNVYLL